MPIAVGTVTLGQVVRQLAAKLAERNVPLPLKNQKPWHELFYRLAQMQDNEGKPAFLKRLVFDWDSPYPQCQQLSEFLEALHSTASASANNPRFNTITIDDDHVKRWSEQFAQFERPLQQFVERATSLATEKFAAAH